MPLDSYTWTHKDAILTTEEKSKTVRLGTINNELH